MNGLITFWAVVARESRGVPRRVAPRGGRGSSTPLRPSRYPAGVTGEPEKQVAALRRLLETELDRRVGPQFGCWPLLVGVLGVLVGIALLFRGR